jgi:hypothetical protein
MGKGEFAAKYPPCLGTTEVGRLSLSQATNKAVQPANGRVITLKLYPRLSQLMNADCDIGHRNRLLWFEGQGGKYEFGLPYHLGSARCNFTDGKTASTPLQSAFLSSSDSFHKE